ALPRASASALPSPSSPPQLADVPGKPIQPGDNIAGHDCPVLVCTGQSLTGLPSYVRRSDAPRITQEAAAPAAATFPGTSVSLDQADRAGLYKKYGVVH